LAWNYPEKAGLEDMATRDQIFPVTMLDLRRSDQLTLLAHRFVTLDDVLSRIEDVRQLLSRESAQDVESQAREVLGR